MVGDGDGAGTEDGFGVTVETGFVGEGDGCGCGGCCFLDRGFTRFRFRPFARSLLETERVAGPHRCPQSEREEFNVRGTVLREMGGGGVRGREKKKRKELVQLLAHTHSTAILWSAFLPKWVIVHPSIGVRHCHQQQDQYYQPATSQHFFGWFF